MTVVRTLRRAGVRLHGGASLVRVTHAAARAYGDSHAAVGRRAMRLRRDGGFEFAEALKLGLLDPAMSPAVRASYVSRHVNMRAQLRLNGHDEPKVLNEKLVFQRFCEGIGVPVPRLVAVIDRAGGSWMLPDRALPIGEGGVDLLPPSFIVKPSGGYEGFGVQLLHRGDGGGLVHHGGRRTTLPELVAELRAHPEFGTWLVQERIRNHPDVAAIGGADTVHTIRFITLVGRDGRAEVLWTHMRLGISGGPVDNFRGGALGNVATVVDPETGVLGPSGRMRENGLGMLESPVIHGTTIRVEGARLPHWEAARELVLRASPEFLPVRTIGWDIALAPDGPVVIEANTRWGGTGVPGMRAVVARLEEAAGR